MFVNVPAQNAYVVERLGRYHATLREGSHLLMPLLDRVAFRFSLRPSDMEISDKAISLDNIPVTVTSRVRWQIVDPERAAYAVADLPQYVAAAAKHVQRDSIAARKYDDARESTRELEAEVVRRSAETLERAGVRFEDVSVLRIERA